MNSTLQAKQKKNLESFCYTLWINNKHYMGSEDVAYSFRIRYSGYAVYKNVSSIENAGILNNNTRSLVVFISFICTLNKCIVISILFLRVFILFLEGLYLMTGPEKH